MREAMRADDFARLVHTTLERVMQLVRLGLLDPDGDARFDDVDLVRYDLIRHHLDHGSTIDELIAAVQDGRFATMFGDRLFGRGSPMSVEDAAARGGVEPEQFRALLVALGLPKEVLDERDIPVSDSLRTILESGLPWEAVLETARVLGDSLRRVADAEIRVVHVHVHERMLAEGASEKEIGRQTFTIQESAGPLLDPMIRWIHEEHLLQASIEDAFLHALAARRSSTELGSVETTILFADVAGFTELVESEGDAVAASVLERLDAVIRTLALRHEGKLVKQIGDGFMLAFREPASAVRFAIALQDVATSGGLPPLRIGINHGTTLHRGGEFVGSAVNIASRVTGAAMPRQILLTESVAASDHGAELEQVGVRLLRGVDAPLPLWRVARHANATDPVCGALVQGAPAARLTRDGEDLVFCSDECLRQFVSAPAGSPAH